MGRRYPETPLLLADSGNFSDNPTAQGEARSRTLLAAMGRLGYAAANVAERDLKAGYDLLAERAAEASFPLISANIVRRDTGAPVFPPHVLGRAVSADGRHEVRVGLIGVTRYNPIFRRPGPEGADLAILHPLEPVRDAVEALRAQGAEVIVLLAALHRDDARGILAEVPGIDFVVGSYGGFVGTEEDANSGGWLLYSGNQGKRLGETRVFLRREGAAGQPIHRLHYLTTAYPDEPGMKEFLVEAATALSEGAAAPQDSDRGYVGPRPCRSCHAAAHAQWASTPHAVAWETLKREGEHEKAACLACHTTAAGQPGGFESQEATPEMASVGCEACHGPGHAHAAAPAPGYGPVELATCTACHDVENSPDFDYYAYRARIVHRGRAPR